MWRTDFLSTVDIELEDIRPHSEELCCRFINDELWTPVHKCRGLLQYFGAIVDLRPEQDVIGYHDDARGFL